MISSIKFEILIVVKKGDEQDLKQRSRGFEFSLEEFIWIKGYYFIIVKGKYTANRCMCCNPENGRVEFEIFLNVASWLKNSLELVSGQRLMSHKNQFLKVFLIIEIHERTSRFIPIQI